MSSSVCAELLNELKRLDRLLDETQVAANKYYSITTKFQQAVKDGIPDQNDKEWNKLIRNYRETKLTLAKVDRASGICIDKVNKLEIEKRKRKAGGAAMTSGAPGSSVEHPSAGGKRFKGDTSIPKGKLVAARVSKDKEVPEEWILAAIIAYDDHKGLYEVEDAEHVLGLDDYDPNAHRKHYFMAASRIVVLPDTLEKCKDYPKGTEVLAMFPDTTSFYRARVEQAPRGKKTQEYILKFDDDDDETGITPQRRVSPLYVLSKQDAGKY